MAFLLSISIIKIDYIASSIKVSTLYSSDSNTKNCEVAERKKENLECNIYCSRYRYKEMF